MFRTIADCLETLEDAGARFYTITGPGINLQHQPEDEAGATVEICLQRFQRDFEKLGPGMYTATHKKTVAAHRNPPSFRFVKVADGAAVGATASADGYALADLERRMLVQQHENEIKWIRREHADEIRLLKSKADQPDGTDKLINAVGQINQLLQNAKSQPVPAVAGTSSAPATPVDEQSAVVNDTVQALHEALGQDETRTLDVLRKIANVARTNPAQINNLVSFL